MERLEWLYAIGEGPGANRIGYSAEEDAAHDLAGMWMEEAGLAVTVDPAGNLLGTDPKGSVPGVWTGSHLDTVPEGGKFDGALGVVAAIEAVERTGSGSVVVFREPDGDLLAIKRVAARPGDRVKPDAGFLVLGDDEAWLLSDAPAAELLEQGGGAPVDSRRYGPVTIDCLVGRAWFRYGPVGRVGRLTGR